MRYEEFFAEYKRVHQTWAYGDMPAENVAGEIARLRGLTPLIDADDPKREWAEGVLAKWESRISGPARERMDRASDVLARTSRAAGTPQQRLEQYRQGIAEIVRISEETDDVNEQDAILELNEMLGTLIDGIEYDQSHPAET